MQKLRVGVLMGGKSIEREVSFNSGRTVCDHLDTTRYTVVPLFQKSDGTLFILPWHFLHRGKIADFEHRLEHEAERVRWSNLKNIIDFMYIATHGRFAEDGTLQGFLEILNIPYLGSKVFSSALSMDKSIQKEMLRAHGIDVPRDISVSPEEISRCEKDSELLAYRLHQAGFENSSYIVKPHAEGSSLGITAVFDEASLLPAILKASSIHPTKKQTVLIEEKLEGMEFSCITLVNYKTGEFIPLPPTEIVPEADTHFFDYDQKYMPGRATKFTPPRCSEEIFKKIQDTCIATMKALEITTISRIDGFVTHDNRVVIIDPNTLSGMGPASFLFREAAEVNMSHTQVINHLIETELHALGILDQIVAHEELQKKDTDQMNQTKTRVAVLLGGESNEREISLESGRNVFYKLSPQKYQAIPIFINQNMELFVVNQSLLVRNSTKEIADNLQPSARIEWDDLPRIADFVFIALHGGKGENGCVQGALEMLNMPYNGSSVLASSMCMDKYKTNEYLRAKGFDVPKSILLSKAEWEQNEQESLRKISESLPLPLIVKPHDDGCSVLVQKANTIEELAAALQTLFAGAKDFALIEECIIAMELTVGVIGNETPQALPPSRAIATGGILSIEEKFLPGAGENQTPAPLPSETLQLVQRTMEEVYKAVGCKGYARIDCFYQFAEQSPTGKERVIVLEINSLPGMTPATCIFHQAAEIGIRPMDFVDLIVQLGFQEHVQQKINEKEEIVLNVAHADIEIISTESE